MVAHVRYPKIVRERPPASLSKQWIDGVLREKIGYRGLVVSDDLDMGGVLNGASIEDAAVGTLEAGSDMFLVCQKEEHVWRAFEAVLQSRRNEIEVRELDCGEGAAGGGVSEDVGRVERTDGSGADDKDRGHAAAAGVGVHRRAAHLSIARPPIRGRAPDDCCRSDERDVGRWD